MPFEIFNGWQASMMH